MKTQKLTPRNAAPVQRENTATVSRDGNAITPQIWNQQKGRWEYIFGTPFAGDDAE
jgi:prenylated cyclic peptide (anacyclamide/piricyclamide family)